MIIIIMMMLCDDVLCMPFVVSRGGGKAERGCGKGPCATKRFFMEAGASFLGHVVCHACIAVKFEIDLI